MPVNDADHRNQDRRQEDDEAPEDEGVPESGHKPLQELALTDDDRRLVADAAAGTVGAIHRGRGLRQAGQEPRPDGEQAGAEGDRPGQDDGRDDAGYVPFAFLISAEIAGTTSCRSPITA